MSTDLYLGRTCRTLGLRNVDLTVIGKYYGAMKKYQDTLEWPIPESSLLLSRLPQLPKDMTSEVKAILRAYRAMARAWIKAGGIIPNPFNCLELLHDMGRNSLWITHVKGCYEGHK